MTDVNGNGAALMRLWLNSELYNRTDVDDLVEALIAERGAAIARAEKAEEQRDRARAKLRPYLAGAHVRKDPVTESEILAALADEPPKE